MTTALNAANPGSIYDTEEVEDREELTQQMLRRLADTGDPCERERLCDEIVLLNMHVAQSIARRYRQRGAEFDDLAQVAHLGLVKAVDRYDPDSGSHFLAFAVPTITGEVKRYFRDYCWAIRPTRRIQEVQHAIASCEPELTQLLGRSPTVSELAEELGVEEDHVMEALASDGYFNLVSLDMPAGWEDSSRSLVDEVGEDDWHLRWVENHELLAPALENLSEREKRLLWLRFEKGWKQTQIAADLGISQMQVSRLLSALLRRLREELKDDGEEEASA
ncbi:MAG: SigB/SigF/SigG family RNA polymerase sigma factor [Actinomycetota bacterium]|nr:SigB/SigF/SigG family RNA polymerase sigma factor [Actinomycetota bacterium]